jgi:hypothetical protein
MIYDKAHGVTIPPGAYPGLNEAVTAAGHALECNNGDWYASDAAAVQQIIDGFTLANAKSDCVARVNAIAKQQFDKAIAGYSSAEVAGWPILRAEAIAYNADASASVPAITQEAQERGVTVAELVAKVTANAATFDTLRATIAGTSGRHRDAIANAADFAELLAYDFTAGWPLP